MSLVISFICYLTEFCGWARQTVNVCFFCVIISHSLPCHYNEAQTLDLLASQTATSKGHLCSI